MVELGSRQLFPRLRDDCYLGHAGVSPVSMLVEEAVQEYLGWLAEEGFGAVPAVLGRRAELRGQLGRLLGCSSEDVALTGGTTWGILTVAQNFGWKRGDRLGLVRGEFPTNVTPWLQAARQFELEVVWLQSDLSDLELQLGKGLRLLALSAVSFQTGLRQPWEEVTRLCHQRDCQVLVDAIQAAGVVPFSVGELDYVVGGAHKWLMGVEGCGYLYVSPQRQGQLHRHWAGWLSHDQAVSFLFEGPGQLRYDRPLRSDMQVYEVGSSAAIAQVALSASLSALLELGIEAIFEHVSGYLDELERGLCDRGWVSLRQGKRGSGILALKCPPSDLTNWASRLAQQGVRVNTPDGWLRLAPHWPNSLAEIPRVLEAFRKGPNLPVEKTFA